MEFLQCHWFRQKMHVAVESWQWNHQVAAPCNVVRGSEMATHEFAQWQHHAMWHEALGSWHWIRPVAAPCNVAGGMPLNSPNASAILEFYLWFRFRPYHRSRHVILHQSVKFYTNRTTLGRKKWRHVDFQDGGSQPSWILGGPIMGYLKSLCTTSSRSSIETIALNCLVFLVFF